MSCEHKSRSEWMVKTNQDGSIYPPHDTLVRYETCDACHARLNERVTVREVSG